MSDPDTMLAIETPGDRFPLVKAMWHYARGVAFARKGEVEQARREAAQIAGISQSNDPDTAYPPDVAPVATDTMAIARHVVEARIARRRAISTGRSRSSRQPCRSRIRLPISSRRSGTTRSVSRSARRCSWPGVRRTPRKCSGKA
jgi:hypothetical protein